MGETELSLDGGISARSVAAIKSNLEQGELIKILHLTSIGGYSSAGEELKILVRKYQLETYVSWDCASACADVFLASDYRSIGLEGLLGFHSIECPGIVVAKDECDLLQTESSKYMLSRGVSKWFVDKVAATKSVDIWEPDFQQLTDAKVITHIFDGEKDIEAKEYCHSNDCSKLPLLESSSPKKNN